MVKKCCLFTAALMLFASFAIAEEFSFSFEWGNIPLCTTGNPNQVPNPRFILSNVPEGTKFIQFTMTDLDVPQYNHGGGTIEYIGSNIIEPGAFKYASPCPPSGSHRYEWKAVAKNKIGLFSGLLGKANSMKKYPDEN